MNISRYNFSFKNSVVEKIFRKHRRGQKKFLTDIVDCISKLSKQIVLSHLEILSFNILPYAWCSTIMGSWLFITQDTHTPA